VLPGSTLFAEDAKPSPESLEFFEKKVRPVLVNNCYNCHSADNKAAGGLRVDDRNGLLTGGGRGTAVVVGNPDESVLIRAVLKTDDKLKMPPDSQLSDEEIGDLKKWIADGAVWPGPEVPFELTEANPRYDEHRKSHWAWQPLQSPPVPEIQNKDWAKDDIDRFVLSQLEQKGLSPVADADRESLLRRVTFDLTGLPPAPAEIEAFLADESPSAYETVVERLLASPAFGERWGRHWLDVARYGESTGSARNLPFPHAWKYRDYVIDSLNKDKPYDRFIREQVAGDLLPSESDDQRKEQLIATGFLAIGVKDVNQRFKVRYVMDNIDEQIDTVTRSVLGLTVSCARCHDHKFDPIPTSEYYGLAGIFNSTDLCDGLRNKMGGGGLDYYDTSKLLVLAEKSAEMDEAHAAKVADAKQKADEAKAEFERIRDSADALKPGPNGRPMQQIARQKWNRLQAKYVALTDPSTTAEIALGVRDAKAISDTEIRYRGEAEQLGPKAPRGVISVVQGPAVPTIPPDQSGRLELAQWLTDRNNPLTSRVIVNRVWHHLFGEGLVRTTDNFGVTGDRPSHPELLDHLAQRLIHNGWSLKSLIRQVVLTRSYRLSSDATPEHLTADPENRLVWRHSPRRLSAEEIRDAQLAASGRLDPTREPGSVAKDMQVIELRNNGPEAKKITDYANTSLRRSVYLPLLRTLVPKSLEVFDFAEQGLVTGARDTTTVPTQALYLLNDSFVRTQALTLAELLVSKTDLADDGRITEAYLRLLGRHPRSDEIERAQSYLAEFSAEAQTTLADAFAAKAESAAVDGEVSVASTEQLPRSEVGAGDAKAALALAQTQAAQLANPDDVAQEEEVPAEDLIVARDASTAAWHSFIQALIGSAEFRYVR
jgi:hypothetical protein